MPSGRLGISLLLSSVLSVTLGADQVPGRQGPPFGPPRDRVETPAGTATIRGAAYAAESGAPLRRVQIRLGSPDLREGRITTTDQDGRFEIRELPAGRYTLTASKGGYVTVQFGQRRPFEPGRPVELAEGQTLTNVNVHLPRGSVITGRIVDEFGEPVAEAMVTARRYAFAAGRRQPVPAVRPVMSNDIGEYRIFGLPPGDYLVSATLQPGMGFGAVSDDVMSYAPTYFPGTPRTLDAQTVTVGLGEEQGGVSFPLIPTRTARLSGIVLDRMGRPASRGNVMLISQEAGGGMMFSRGSAMVRADGTFQLTGVTPGDYQLQIRAGSGPETQEFAMLPITVAGEDLSGLTLTLGAGGRLSGTIETDQGLPPPFPPSEVTLVAMPAGGEILVGGFPQRPVEEDWSFELTGLVGPRVLRARTPPGWVLKAILRDGIDITDTPVELRPDEEVRGLRVLVSDRPTEVTGHVTDDRGAPVADYTVVIFAADASLWTPHSRHVQAARPDQQGRFLVRGLPPDRYHVVAVDYLPQGEWADPDVLARLVADAAPVTLRAGETQRLTLGLVTLP